MAVRSVGGYGGLHHHKDVREYQKNAYSVLNAWEGGTADDRRANEERLVCGYHDALVAAGVDGYSWEECWDDYGRSLLSALMTTIFGAMYGVRSERGDEMFVIMGGRHARQILDLGVDSLLH